ncbi:MAG: SDR family NAD(P)-dependent oxidoreductase [Nitrosarchaeum sp.]|nr:SDR family NAD(P)-dependent oxidoreductase [Nitrosarchaeum sp.]
MKSTANTKTLLKNKTVLVTGGAGSIGSALVRRLLDFPIKAVRVLDIDEHGLFKLNRSIDDKRFRPLLGSVMDRERVDMAMQNVDIVFHLAAVKNIEITEFNPIETIDVIINGTVNVIKSTITHKPGFFINISTDKAADASTLYGSTKQLAEKLTSWAGFHVESTNFGTVRLGNVLETRGNVFEIWNDENNEGKPLSITDPLMTRYYFSVNEAVDFILLSMSKIKLGEICIPKMKKYNMIDLASKISKKHKIIGIRRGEKLDEILLTEDEKAHSQELSNMWIIKTNS